MRFLLLLERAGADGAGAPAVATDADDELRQTLCGFRARLAAAGVLLDAAALQPATSDPAWRRAGEPGVGAARSPGPAERAVVGYALIDVRSQHEAWAWAASLPLPACGFEIAVRALVE